MSKRNIFILTTFMSFILLEVNFWWPGFWPMNWFVRLIGAIAQVLLVISCAGLSYFIHTKIRPTAKTTSIKSLIIMLLIGLILLFLLLMAFGITVMWAVPRF